MDTPVKPSSGIMLKFPLHRNRRVQSARAQDVACPISSGQQITKTSVRKIKLHLTPRPQETATRVVNWVQAPQASSSTVCQEHPEWPVVCAGLPIGSSKEQQIAAAEAILHNRVMWETFLPVPFESEAAQRIFATAAPRHILNPVTRQLYKEFLEDIEELEESGLSPRKTRKVSAIKLDMEKIRGAMWGLQLSKARNEWTTRGCFTEQEEKIWAQAIYAAKMEGEHLGTRVVV